MRMFLIENPLNVCFRNPMERTTTQLTLLAALGLMAQTAVVHAASCDTAKAPPVPVVKDLPYEQARQAVLAAGWQAVTGHPHNDLSSNESTFRDRGFTELQFCRISADSTCRFKFAQGPYLLWLTSTGDENTALQTTATVKAAKLTCSGEPDPN